MPDIRSPDNEYPLDDFSPEELGALEEEDTISISQQTNKENDSVTGPTFNTKKQQPLRDISNSTHTSTPLPQQTTAQQVYYKTIQREKETRYKVVESKSTKQNILLQDDTTYPHPFTCEATCIQHVSYKLLSNMSYKPFDLDKLDIVLNAESILVIQIDCTLNELDTLGNGSWIADPLNKVMEKSEFRPLAGQQKGTFRYIIQKAFVTTPLSYLLEKQAPHGILEKLYISLDWSTANSKELQLAWTDQKSSNGFKRESMTKYIEDTLLELITRRVFCSYPLVFSVNFVKEMTPVISYLPHVSQSLLKMIKTAKATSPNKDFNERMNEKLKMIERNTRIMRPPFSSGSNNNGDKEVGSSDNSQENDQYDDIKNSTLGTDLTLGLYYTIKKMHKYPQQFPSAKSHKSFGTPPDALEAIGKIWSVTCSSASPTLTEQ